MSFLVEDGTGLTESNSYASVAFFKSYWDLRGFDYSSYADSKIEIALVQASDYINNFHSPFKGCYLLETQAMQFPRFGIYDAQGGEYGPIPSGLVKACVEYAKESLSNPLSLAPEQDSSGMGLTYKRQKVGPLEEEFRYNGSYAKAKFPQGDKLLFPFKVGARTLRRN